MATGKRVYRLITRGVFGFVDREGGGTRLAHDAPRMIAAFTTNPQVHGAAVVAYPDNRMNTGLYAFVETTTMSDDEAGKLIEALDVRMPEHIQVVEALPRDAAGEVRTEILQLIAMNQLDQLTPLINTPAELAVVARIIANRKNLKTGSASDASWEIRTRLRATARSGVATAARPDAAARAAPAQPAGTPALAVLGSLSNLQAERIVIVARDVRRLAQSMASA